ncbi:DgyrCDS3301 [Dimorphilus gyrociliatus]|uniref:DgyrCDS3301 n=1 Tax=Dimorphilus gyrociliatus TaxID=2664684 RepID=A0A7I8VEQ1_9ANNE|nr:DgyrCDS3301 [Dimorphilus gyrociliatus]
MAPTAIWRSITTTIASIFKSSSHIKNFTILIILYTFTGLIADTNIQRSFLCRQCGHTVVFANDLTRVASDMSLRQRNDSLLGRKGTLIQLLQNPAGARFEVITSKRAHVTKSTVTVSSDTWFTGFSWRIATCPKCHFHLGWSYEPLFYKGGLADSKDTFYALILDNLLDETYADNLIITPKVYQS